MSSSESESLSRVYVLRCWVEPQTQPSPPAPTWRFRLEDVRNEQHVGFATVADLVIFLQEAFGNSNSVTIIKE